MTSPSSILDKHAIKIVLVSEFRFDISFVLKIKMSIVYIFKFLFYSNCTRSWVRAVIGSNQRLYIWHLFLLSTHHLRKNAKTGWLGIRIIYASGATCLPADCCFGELVFVLGILLLKNCWVDVKQQSLTHSNCIQWLF